jgi:transcriptional regulator with XRE-family HTH domain
MLEARDVGRAMERLRGDRTQRSVAGRAGINRSSWSSYEAGRRMPTPETWSRIVAGLETTMVQFDRAVQRAWAERNAEAEGRPAPGPAAAAPPAGEHLQISAEEALELVACSGRLQDLGKRLLDRLGPRPPPRL